MKDLADPARERPMAVNSLEFVVILSSHPDLVLGLGGLGPDIARRLSVTDHDLRIGFDQLAYFYSVLKKARIGRFVLLGSA